MSLPAEILTEIYFCRDTGAGMEIDFRLVESNDWTLEREVHFRPDRSDLRTSAKKKRRKMKSLPGGISKRRSLILVNNMMSEERFV